MATGGVKGGSAGSRKRRGSFDAGAYTRFPAQDAAGGRELAFGKPFTFGAPLTFTRLHGKENDSQDPGPLWRNLSYLDPAMLWLPSGSLLAPVPAPKQQKVKASVVPHRKGSEAKGQQIPAPAAVTITHAPTQGVSGVDVHSKASGLAIREHTQPSRPSVLDVLTQNTYPVYERIDKHEARRRVLAAASAQGLLALLSGPAGSGETVHSNLTTLQRVVQAWTEEEKAAQATPAPGQYDVNPTKQNTKTGALGGPAFTMGKRTDAAVSGRSLVPKDAPLLPGPGQYDVEKADKNTGPAYTLPGRPKDPPPSALPGPGQYNAELPSIGEGPAFTIRGKVTTKAEELPGPGDYDLATCTRTGAAFTIAGKPKEKAAPPSPGPADYQRIQPAGKDAPAFSLLGRVDEPVAKADLPAPGDYSVPEAWRNGPAVTMAGRHRERQSDMSPGPGQYTALRTSLDGPAYTMAGRVPEPELFDAPGPGDYDVRLAAAAPVAPAFTMGARWRDEGRESRDARLLPGPGQYQPGDPGSPRAPAYTIGARREATVETQDGPGPGAYEVVTDTLGVGPAYTMTGRPAAGSPPPDSPGPGQYSPSHIGKTAPAYTIGTLPSQPLPTDSPAPGDYEVRVSIHAGPAYTIPAAGIHPPRASPPASPGPGEYDVPGALPAGPAYTIPAAGRAERAPEESPGPGDYAASVDLSRTAPAYTIAERRPESPRPPSPAPGEYHRDLPRAGPSYTIRGKAREESPTRSVGPGEYEPHDPSLPSAPAYTIATRPLDRQHEDDAPGPGSYDSPASPRGPAYTMRGRPASPTRTADSPGPGAHDVPLSTRDGPAYTIRGRHQDREPDEGPGPGDYTSPRLDTGPAYTIRSRSPDPVPPSSPGPGDYTVPRAPGGPAYTMAGRHQELTVLGDAVHIDTDIPGPGAYGAPGQELIGQSGPAYTMRPKTRVMVDAEPGGDSPGPGAYPLTKTEKGRAFTMGAQYPAPSSPKPCGPGPGAYGAPMPQDKESSPAFTMYERVKGPRPTKDDCPGPGEYAGDHVGQGMSPTGPAYTLSPRLDGRNPAIHMRGPGPGEHQRVLHPPTGPAFTLGKRLRDLLGLKKKGLREAPPEPGQYYNPPGPSGPAYSFAPRVETSPRKDGPAPGDYDTGADGPTGPAFTIQKKYTQPRAPMVPGPGAYNTTGAAAARAVSSILHTRPLGRAEYAVQRLAYPDRLSAPLGDAQLPTAPVQTSRPARDVAFGSGVHQPRGAGPTGPSRHEKHHGAVPRKDGTKGQAAGKGRLSEKFHYLSQPATNVYVYRPAGHKVQQTVSLAQPAPTYTAPAGQALVPGPDPKVVARQRGAAGKTVIGIVRRGKQQLAAPPAVKVQTAAAAGQGSRGAAVSERQAALQAQYTRY